MSAIIGTIIGGIIGASASLIAVFLTYKLQACKEEKERKRQLESIISIIYSELKVEKSTWQQKPTISRYKKLKGFDLLLLKGLQDMLSSKSILYLMDTYYNLNRIYTAMDKIDEEYLKRLFQANEDNSAEQNTNSLIDRLVSNHQDDAIRTLDKCISEIEQEAKLKGWKIKSG